MRALGSCSSASLNRDEARVTYDDQMPPWGTRAILALAHGGVKLTGRLPGRIGEGGPQARPAIKFLRHFVPFRSHLSVGL